MSAVDLETPEAKEAIKKAAEALVETETRGLKKKNDELLDEIKPLKELQAKFKDFDPDEYKALKKLKTELDDKDGDPVKIRERIEAEFNPKLTQLQQERDNALKQLNDSTIEAQLTSALADAGVAKEFVRAVKAELSSSKKVEVKDGGVIIDGKPVGDFVKAWSESDGKAFISAPNNKGGGSRGGNPGGAGGEKKASEMTRAEKAEFQTEHGLEAWKTKINNES